MDVALLPVNDWKTLCDRDLIFHRELGVARYEGHRTLSTPSGPEEVLILRFACKGLLYVQLPNVAKLMALRVSGDLLEHLELDRLGVRLRKWRLVDANTIRSATESKTGDPLSRRRPIREAVRHEVWRRDGGKCVRCGSRERLEFDHIVPVIRGGSDTARNIELLCENCNRKKGSTI